MNEIDPHTRDNPESGMVHAPTAQEIAENAEICRRISLYNDLSKPLPVLDVFGNPYSPEGR